MKPQLSETVIHYILQCPSRELPDLDIEKIAQTFNVSQNLEAELKSFIEHERILRAVRFIEEGIASDCRELASKLGYRDLSGFRASFKDVFLVEPEIYIALRKLQKASEGNIYTIPLRIAAARKCIYA
jgi:AraC-like DNA-binding protein